MSGHDEQKLIKWLWLSQKAYSTPASANTFLKYFGGIDELYAADEASLAQVEVRSEKLGSLLADKDLSGAERILAYCRENGVGTVTPDDYFYPRGVAALHNRPVLLYYLGNFSDLDQEPCAAIVGSRNPSDYGIRCAKTFSWELAKAGVVTVSGLASGIDSCAHRASLYAGAFTVGVLGCGIDVVYPKENAELYGEVAKNGLIITEFPPSTPPAGSNFPLRNRIIAALGEVTVVVEGSSSSGSLITAEYALRAKKPLFAVPGSVFWDGCSGSNALLRLGAEPLLEASQVLEKLSLNHPELRPEKAAAKKQKRDRIPREGSSKKKKIKTDGGDAPLFSSSGRLTRDRAQIPPAFSAPKETPSADGGRDSAPSRPSIARLDGTQLEIYTRLSAQPVTPDELVNEKMNAKTVLKTLTALEMEGFVRRIAGGRFEVAGED